MSLLRFHVSTTEPISINFGIELDGSLGHTETLLCYFLFRKIKVFMEEEKHTSKQY